jgi:hypothetical protein
VEAAAAATATGLAIDRGTHAANICTIGGGHGLGEGDEGVAACTALSGSAYVSSNTVFTPCSPFSLPPPQHSSDLPVILASLGENSRRAQSSTAVGKSWRGASCQGGYSIGPSTGLDEGDEKSESIRENERWIFFPSLPPLVWLSWSSSGGVRNRLG